MSKKGDTIQKGIFLICFAIIGAIFGVFIGKYFGDGANTIYFPKSLIWLIIIGIFPIYLLAIAVHEGGHALFGISQNFDFRMYVAGPFIFEKEVEQWKFKWNKSFNLFGGLVLCLPKDDVNLSKRFSIFVAGGPLASLISAFLCFGVFKLMGGTGEEYSVLHNSIALLLLLYSIFSGFIFLATILPFSAGGFHSDGARLIRFNKGGNTSKLEILILTIFSKISAGIRPKDYDVQELLEAKQLSNKIQDNYEVYFDGFLFQNAFDKYELESAENYLNEYLSNIEKVPEPVRGSLWLDAALFYAFGRKDLIKAKEYFAKYKPSPMIPKAQVLTTEASLLKLEGKMEEMNIKINQALAEIPSLIDKGLGNTFKLRLLEMRG